MALLLTIPTISALPIHSTPIISSSAQINSTFSFVFNLTTSSDCTEVVLSNASTLTTDSRGIAFININISGITPIPSYLCEFRNGSLRMTHLDSDQIFREVYVDGTLKTRGTVSINTTSNPYTATVNGTMAILDTFTLTQMTLGSILFASTGGRVAQNNTFLNWDNANGILRLPWLNATNNVTVNGSSVCLSNGVNCQIVIASVLAADNNYLYNDSTQIHVNETPLNRTTLELINTVATNKLNTTNYAPNTTTGNGSYVTTNVNGREIKITIAESILNQTIQDLSDLDTTGGGWAVNTSSCMLNDSAGRIVNNLTCIDGRAAAQDTYNSTEQMQDAVGSALTDTGTVDLVYDDAANTISANSLGNTSEQMQDVTGAGFVNSLTYDDGGNSFDVADDSINGTELTDTIVLDALLNFLGGFDFAVNSSNLYVNVTAKSVGINSTSASNTLVVNGSARIVNLTSCSKISTDSLGQLFCATDIDTTGGGHALNTTTMINDSDNKITVLPENLQDEIGNIIKNGSGINAAYDDTGDRIVIATTGDNTANQSFNDTQYIPWANSTTQVFLKTGFFNVMNLTNVQVNFSNFSVSGEASFNGNVSFKQSFEKYYPGLVMALSSGSTSTPTHTNSVKTIPTATAVSANFSIHLDISKTIAGSSVTIRNVTWSFTLPAGVRIVTKRLYVLDISVAQITNIYNNGTPDNQTSVNHSAGGLPYVIDSNRANPALMLDLEISGPGGIGQSVDLRGVKVVYDTD